MSLLINGCDLLRSATTRTPSVCATRLRHTPTVIAKAANLLENRDNRKPPSARYGNSHNAHLNGYLNSRAV